MLQVEQFVQQCRILLCHCCRFWQQRCRFRQQCRTKFRPFDKVERNWTCSICFDFVERTKFYHKLVRHCCRLWQQSRMMLRQSRTLLRQCCLLLRHCCWCGRGLTLPAGRMGGRPPPGRARGRPTLHGGPIQLRPVRATPCIFCADPILFCFALCEIFWCNFLKQTTNLYTGL